MVPPPSELKVRIAERIAARAPFSVWTPTDFLDLGDRNAVDKALQRLARAGEIRRITRGLYDKPQASSLTHSPTAPDYRQIIQALGRRDQTRMLVDGLTAANDLGLTDAVPARVVVHTDARRRAIRLGNLTIEFKKAAPSRLYWAGRPAMRVVQALHWLKDTLPRDREQIMSRLRVLLHNSAHGPAIRDDLHAGLPTLPAWMQGIVRELLDGARADDPLYQRAGHSGGPSAVRSRPGDTPDRTDGDHDHDDHDHDDDDDNVPISDGGVVNRADHPPRLQRRRRTKRG